MNKKLHDFVDITATNDSHFQWNANRLWLDIGPIELSRAFSAPITLSNNNNNNKSETKQKNNNNKKLDS